MNQLFFHFSNWLKSNKLYWIGAVLGAIAGFLYWKYVGCITGNCAITSKPVSSMFYFAFIGSIFLGLFNGSKKSK